MYKLKLIKGRSYTGRGVKATEKNYILEVRDKELADWLVTRGYFSLIAEAETSATGTAEAETEVEKMSLAQLKALAQQMELDTKGLKSKADYIAAINAAEELFTDEA